MKLGWSLRMMSDWQKHKKPHHESINCWYLNQVLPECESCVTANPAFKVFFYLCRNSLIWSYIVSMNTEYLDGTQNFIYVAMLFDGCWRSTKLGYSCFFNRYEMAWVKMKTVNLLKSRCSVPIQKFCDNFEALMLKSFN